MTNQVRGFGVGGALLSDRLLRLLPLAVLAGVLIAVVAIEMTAPGMFAPDANTYRAAAERLNAGHLLYALSPGDRPIQLYPPYWTVPLLSPPPIAVVWRPLALLPGDSAIYLWWLAMTLSIAATLALLVRRAPVVAAVAGLLAAIPIALSIKYGNINGALLLMAVLTWYAATHDREDIAGLLVASMIALKLTPFPLLIWLVAIGRKRAAISCIIGLVAWAVVSIAGAGLTAHLTYIDVARNTLVNGSPGFDFASIGRRLGIPTVFAAVIPWAWWTLCVALMAIFRARSGLSFGLATFAFVLGSPVIHTDSLMVAVALVAPIAWPSTGSATQADPS